ncbi:MAG: PPOX class F420-dependent oxidoreductase [Carbonactinosporaceae bacterium]
MFTEAELAYLRSEPRLARIATVGPDGTPHVTPVGWSLAEADTVIEVGGIDLSATKKFRDVARTGRAAIVIDDLASVRPWHVRGIEVRGLADARTDPEPRILIHPKRVISWGLDADRSARDIAG